MNVFSQGGLVVCLRVIQSWMNLGGGMLQSGALANHGSFLHLVHASIY